MNARTEITVAKIEDEFRVQFGGGDVPLPDEDLRTPVIPGLYLLDLALQYRTPGSLVGTNGFRLNFSGPLGITDGGYGAFAQIGTPQRNDPDTGLLTIQDAPTAAVFINTNQYFNRSGWIAVRESGDLILNWTSIIPGGAGVSLLRGSTVHLVRAVNDGDE